MISIRENVFETNSSSCHSMTLSCKREVVDDFNAGKLFYVEFPGENRQNSFHTPEEVVEKLKNILPDEAKVSDYDTFSRSIDVWTYENDDQIDEKNFIKWLLDNLTVDMLEWAFSNDLEPKYFSRKIIKTALQNIVSSAWCSPLWKVDDFFNNDNSIDVSAMDDSDVDLDYNAKKFVIEDTVDNPIVRIKLDFRN